MTMTMTISVKYTTDPNTTGTFGGVLLEDVTIQLLDRRSWTVTVDNTAVYQVSDRNRSDGNVSSDRFWRRSFKSKGSPKTRAVERTKRSLQLCQATRCTTRCFPEDEGVAVEGGHTHALKEFHTLSTMGLLGASCVSASTTGALE